MRRLLLMIGIALVPAATGATAAPAANLANERAVLSFAISNPCTGEDVVGEIRVHFVLNLTTNGNNVSGMELLQTARANHGGAVRRKRVGSRPVHSKPAQRAGDHDRTWSSTVWAHG